MKTQFSILSTALIFTMALAAQNDFHKEQLFNRGPSPAPFTGLDVLRKHNPYIVIRDITNATNGKQLNREKYVSIPHLIDGDLYKAIGSYTFDSIKKEWKIVELDTYFIGYDFNSKAVPFAYIHKMFADSTKNTQTKTTFSFKGKNMPDTQVFYTISKTDTIFHSRNVFYHDSLNRILHISQYMSNGSSFETSWSYSPEGKLVLELSLFSKSQFATPDSFSRIIYTYDSAGMLAGRQEEMYSLPGHPDSWTATQLTTYTYNAKGLLSGDRIYKPDANYQLVLDHLHLYSYNNQEQIETFIQMRYYQGNFVDRRKLVVFYENGFAKYGYEYPWEDTDYNHTASRYYVFSKEEISGIPETRANHAPLGIVPNPATGEISLSALEENSHVQIFDNFGKLVLNATVNQDLEIDISVLPAGIYIVMSGNHLPAKLVKS